MSLEMFEKFINNEIFEIPESFFKQYESLKHPSYFYEISSLIDCSICDCVEDLWKPKIILNDEFKLNSIRLMISFLNKYDLDINKDDIIFSKQEIYKRINNYFDEDITEDNIIKHSLNYLSKNKNKGEFVADAKKENLLTNMADYFEWMIFDDQIEFWNIITSTESNNHCSLRVIERVLSHTSSIVFIDYAFDKYDKLYSEKEIIRITFKDIGLIPCTEFFFQRVVQLYPRLKDGIIILLIICNSFMLLVVFPNLTNQEIISALKNKFF